MPAVDPSADRPKSLRLWISSHPAPRFVIVGGIAAVVDVATLRLLHGELGVELLIATALAYLVSGIPSFLLNRHWAFVGGADGVVHQQAGRFLLSIGVNLGATLLIVGGLSWLGVYYLLAKVIAIAINAIGNFFAYRHWVFTAR